ncbi:GNAT family N-acetyltransferase [Aeromonas simiae]|uniref:GNAT family N-acetyltransferase n=1 Tax=Aeromonas simiae TaxID=218936 RepID=UPI00266B606C|nr:GNAT family N-acetyltransferase [Aeromonas simiae]MDO2949429.1 GNAT family N-acetyltransferase [Aeromonas simiae]MDO2953051.1 GNAT family N-acetyltransferase [Aeromonas simiae]MDO2956701.1 GNAT family N-acetyltransferase [Aeromonas simiae]
MVQISRLNTLGTEDACALAHLLIVTVQDGASIGFMASLDAHQADTYWQGVARELPLGLHLWVAHRDGAILGTVQLAPCGKDNGRHRGEVQKLFVHPAARGLGIARTLLATLEEEACRLGLTLLVLDTEAGSDAEHLYRRQGWQKCGEIPDYALSPDGRPHATAYYYKRPGA